MWLQCGVSQKNTTNFEVTVVGVFFWSCRCCWSGLTSDSHKWDRQVGFLCVFLIVFFRVFWSCVYLLFIYFIVSEPGDRGVGGGGGGAERDGLVSSFVT